MGVTISLDGFVADLMLFNLECSISVIELVYNNKLIYLYTIINRQIKPCY